MTMQSSRLIFILAIGVFGILNTEMGVVGMLPLVANEFHVDIATAGWLVSAFALVVAVAGPTMPLLCSKINRKTLMLLSPGIFLASNLVSAWASEFWVLLAARMIPAAFHPAYVSMAFTEAAKSVPPAESAKAVSKVFAGVSAGMVLGVPATAVIANTFSLSAAMLFFAVFNLIALIMTALFIPSLPVAKETSYGEQLQIVKKTSLLLSIGIVIFLNGAIFGFFSYISDYLGIVTGLAPEVISLYLFAYGLANIVGNMLAGKLLSTYARLTTLFLPFVLLLAYAVLYLAGSFPLATCLVVVGIGVLAGVNANMNQFIVAKAGREAPELANGLYLTSANLGTTLGTYLCGLFILSMGSAYALLGTFVFLLIGGFLVVTKIFLNQRKEKWEEENTSVPQRKEECIVSVTE